VEGLAARNSKRSEVLLHLFLIHVCDSLSSLLFSSTVVHLDAFLARSFMDGLSVTVTADLCSVVVAYHTHVSILASSLFSFLFTLV